MNNLRRKLIAVAAVAGFAVIATLTNPDTAAAQGGPNVHIAGPLPLPVKEVSNAPRTPFQAVLCTATIQSLCGQKPFNFIVPAHQRAVVEYASATCFSPVAARLHLLRLDTIVGGTAAPHSVGPLTKTSFSATQDLYTFGQQVTIYADPGTGIAAAQFDSAAGPVCETTISGHLVAQ